MNATTTAPATIADALARYEAALAAHSRDWSSVHPACVCGFSGKSRNVASAARGVGLHVSAAHKRAEREYDAVSATIRATPEGRAEVAALYADAVRERTTRAYVAPKVESVEPIENRLHIDPSEFSEGGTCTACENPDHTVCPLVTGCECCEANAEEQIAEEQAEPEFVKVQTTDGYGTPHMVLRRADLAAAGRAANADEDVNENATEEQHLAMLEEEYDALREEQDGNTPGTPRAAWVADRLNLLAGHMRRSAARIEQARGIPTEQDLAPSAVPEQRYEVQGETTAADLRPGDFVVGPTGYRAFAAFDVSQVYDLEAEEGDPNSLRVKVWTAIADQERGLPPVLDLPGDRPVRISRVAAVQA